MAIALISTGRRGRRTRPWLLRRGDVWPIDLLGELSVVWIRGTRTGEPIDLECIGAPEADRRAAAGEIPTGVMIGGTLFRREVTRRLPPAWLERAGRIVVCEIPPPDPSPNEARLGAARVRWLPRPFGPRTFGIAVAWLAGRPGRWSLEDVSESSLGDSAA